MLGWTVLHFRRLIRFHFVAILELSHRPRYLGLWLASSLANPRRLALPNLETALGSPCEMRYLAVNAPRLSAALLELAVKAIVGRSFYFKTLFSLTRRTVATWKAAWAATSLVLGT